MTPEQMHVLVNHLPTVGLAFALLALAVGTLRRQASIQRLGLWLVVAATLTTPLLARSGEAAEERLHLTLDPVALETLLPEHEERGERAAIALYVALGLAVVALVLGRRRPERLRMLAAATLVAGLAGLALAAWAGLAGGKIRHPELRAASAVVVDDD